MDADRYLERIGVDPADHREPGLDALAELQRAHVTTVPFETLSVTGDPYGDAAGEGVSLDLEDLYEKIVERHRGGFCYELNGLFGWLLADRGYDVTRVAGAVLTDGEPRPPANHLTTIVSLDRDYVADVGLGVPPLRRPLPLDGEPRTDEAGATWRLAESDRPDADYLTQYRVGEGNWQDRYVFRRVPRDLAFVSATCEYLSTAPESPFTGDPVLTLGTDRGWKKATPEELTRVTTGTERTEPITVEEWPNLLSREFDIELDSS